MNRLAPSDHISAALAPAGSDRRMVVPAYVGAVGVSTVYVTVAKAQLRGDQREADFAFENGWYAVDNVEGVTWVRGWEGEAVDALKASCALR